MCFEWTVDKGNANEFNINVNIHLPCMQVLHVKASVLVSIIFPSCQKQNLRQDCGVIINCWECTEQSPHSILSQRNIPNPWPHYVPVGNIWVVWVDNAVFEWVIVTEWQNTWSVSFVPQKWITRCSLRIKLLARCSLSIKLLARCSLCIKLPGVVSVLNY